jgi:hypothetical protein
MVGGKKRKKERYLGKRWNLGRGVLRGKDLDRGGKLYLR